MKIITSALRTALAAALVLVLGAANAADQKVLVELNKLVPRDDACRVYLVLQNTGATEYETLKLDLVVFDVDGIFDKRFIVDVAPLPAGKTSLKEFDIGGLACPRIGRLLLNDAVTCRDGSGTQIDCLADISTRARGAVSFIK